MTKLHIALTGLQQESSPEVQAVVWENGAALSRLDIFSLIRKKATNDNWVRRIQMQITGLGLKVQRNAHVMDILQLNANNLETKLQYLVAEIKSLDAKYEAYIERAISLSQRLAQAKTLAGNVDTDKLLRIETSFSDTKKTLDFLTLARANTDLAELDLRVTQNQTDSLANKAGRMVSNLGTRVSEFNRLLQDIDRRIAAIKRLSINVEKNAGAGEFMFEVIVSSFNTLVEKQEERKEKIEEFNKLLVHVTSICIKTDLELNKIEREFKALQAKLEETRCDMEARVKTLAEIEAQCDSASATLDEYFDLFVGCNFLAAGDNIQLNRAGCSCVVSAVMPDLPSCPQVPVAPSIPPDLYVSEGPLPKCPPQMCGGGGGGGADGGTGTTAAPDSPTTTKSNTTTTKKPTTTTCKPTDCGRTFSLGGGGRNPDSITHDFSCYKGMVEVEYSVFGANAAVKINNVRYEYDGTANVNTANNHNLTVEGINLGGYGTVIYTLNCLDDYENSD